MADDGTPVFAPDGTVRSIPQDQLNAALQAGGKRALRFSDPTGTARYVPEDQKDAALQSGGKLLDGEPNADTHNLGFGMKVNVPGSGGVIQSIENGASDLVAGAGKSLGDTVAPVSSYLSKIPYIGKYLAPQQGVTAMKSVLDEPRNTMQKLGGGLEQAGEMMALGGPLKQGAEYAGTRLLPAALQKFGLPALRVGAEALNAGTVAGAHGENPGPAAAVGAGGQMLSEALPLLAPFLKRSAQKEYGQVLAPTTKANKNITQRIVPELLDKKVIGTAQGIANRADAEVDSLGNQIGAAVSNVPASQKPDVQGVLQHLDDYKKTFQVNGVSVDPDAIQKADDLQTIIKQLGPDVSYQDLNKVRQLWDAKVARAGGYAGKTMEEGSKMDVQREAANSIRQELAKASPDVAALNAKFHFWKGVSDVIDATNERRTGQMGGLIAKAAPVLGAAAGLSHGGASVTGGVEAALGAAALTATTNFFQSPLWKTTAAVTKNELAQKLASGQYRSVLHLITRAGAAAASATGNTGQTKTSPQLSAPQQQ